MKLPKNKKKKFLKKDLKQRQRRKASKHIGADLIEDHSIQNSSR